MHLLEFFVCFCITIEIESVHTLGRGSLKPFFIMDENNNKKISVIIAHLHIFIRQFRTTNTAILNVLPHQKVGISPALKLCMLIRLIMLTTTLTFSISIRI